MQREHASNAGACARLPVPRSSQSSSRRTIRRMSTRQQNAKAPKLFVHLTSAQLDVALRLFLREDHGEAGDITSTAMIPATRQATAVIRARTAGTLSGVPIAKRLLAIATPRLRFQVHARDGEKFRSRATIATLRGPLRDILKVERIMLNLLGHLSGVATATHALVARVANTDAEIRDTRKTTPGLRAFEKYAVTCGGGLSHRSGLFDAFLAKDNHLVGLTIANLPTAVTAAVAEARRASHPAFVMIEVDTAAQFKALLSLPRGIINAVLLDNMSLAALRRLVALRDQRAPWLQLEASGGITLRTVAAVARSGVDFISVGSITHSAPHIDFGLDIQQAAK